MANSMAKKHRITEIMSTSWYAGGMESLSACSSTVFSSLSFSRYPARCMEKIVPATAMPMLIPTCLSVAIRAEAEPRRSLSTAPMMMLLLGGWKLPTPIPRRARSKMMVDIFV